MIIEIKMKNGSIIKRNTKNINAFGENDDYFFIDNSIFRKDNISNIDYIGDVGCQNLS